MATSPRLRQQRAFRFFVDKGWSVPAAAALAGNAMQESGQKLSTRAVGDRGTAFGLFQWRKDRQDRLRQFARERGKRPDDFETQLEYADWELRNIETGPGQRLAQAGSVEDANDAVLQYLRPAGYDPKTGDTSRAHGRNRRLKFSQDVLGAAEEIVGEVPQSERSPAPGSDIPAIEQQHSESPPPKHPSFDAEPLDIPEAEVLGDIFGDLPGVPAPPKPPESEPMSGGGGFELPPPPSFEVDVPEERPEDRIPFKRMREAAVQGPLPALPPLPPPPPVGGRRRRGPGGSVKF